MDEALTKLARVMGQMALASVRRSASRSQVEHWISELKNVVNLLEEKLSD